MLTSIPSPIPSPPNDHLLLEVKNIMQKEHHKFLVKMF